MNNLDKKIELVRHILTLSIEISNNSIIDIFADYAAHVNSFSVRVLKTGWNNEGYRPDFEKTIYLNWDNSEKELKNTLDYLIKIKEEK